MKPENWHLYAMLCCLLFVFACDRGAQPRQEQDVTRASANPSAPLDASSATPAKSGQVNPANRDKILSMLTGFEHVPSAEDLYAVEPDGDNLRATLLDIYRDKSAKKGARQRALTLMRHIPGDTTLRTYEEILTAASTPDADRRAAIKAYGACAGQKGEPTLVDMLAHSDAHTRAAAAVELGEIGTDSARSALEARAQVEPVPHVRIRIGKALGRDIGPAPTSDANGGTPQ